MIRLDIYLKTVELSSTSQKLCIQPFLVFQQLLVQFMVFFLVNEKVGQYLAQWQEGIPFPEWPRATRPIREVQ